ncbi:hypothetical protein [Herbihabitans rhizosphaerae]|uniref:hypothetical protein n=1 Tax=Herbihabitans rhizosphaerae TaxID=1872711 RepID=UPI00102B7AD1|nr:hypothetical protein [Herbihabitans rhizosphaerae]
MNKLKSVAFMACAGLVVSVLASNAASAAVKVDRIVGSKVLESPTKVAEYWTPERMAAAVPADATGVDRTGGAEDKDRERLIERELAKPIAGLEPEREEDQRCLVLIHDWKSDRARDFAFVITNNNADGRRVVDAAGGHGLTVNPDRPLVHIAGYPVDRDGGRVQ